MSAIEDPLVDPPPREVPLKDAPLVLVIAQVRFPEVLMIEQRDFVAPFQEALRAAYPVLRQEQTHRVVLGPDGFAPTKPATAWRFTDVAGNWRVSLTPEFLSLEAMTYTSRADFFERLRTVIAALNVHVEPKLVDRLGVRYIDRISGDALVDIKRLIRPEVLGITGTRAGAHTAHALSETMFKLPGANVLARWGRIPAGTTVDPSAIEAAEEDSWILDLDMFGTAQFEFDVDRIVSDAQKYAERIYTIFRWVVTDEFLRHYGGTP